MKKILCILILMICSLGQSQTPAAGPTSPPARNAWDVLSQYGTNSVPANQYTHQSGVVFDSFGGSNIVGDVVLGDGNTVKKYISHSYSGIKTNGAGDLNVSGMTHLHMDVWSPDFVSFKIKLEASNGSNNEIEVPFTKVQGSWNSYDIPLSTYVNTNLLNLRWIVPVTFGPNNTTLFITNVYFYRPATLLPPTVGSFTVPAQSVGAADFALTPPTSNNTSPFTYTSSNTNVATIVNGNELHIVGGGSSTITALQVSDGSYGPSSTPATFVASYPTPGPSPAPPMRAANTVVSMFTGTPPAYANVVNAVRAPWTAGTTLTTIPNGSDTCLQVDNFGYLGYITDGANFSAAGMTKLHVDVYLNTPIANMFIFLLSNGDQLYNTGALVAGWNSLDINLSSFPGANLADIYGFKFEHNQGAARQIYLDNIYFYVGGNDPVITDFTIPTKVFGDANFALTTPTSNSAGAFTYMSSNSSVATIVNGNEIHITGIGTSTITANQAADGGFDAGSISAPFVVTAPPLTTPAPTPPVRNSYDVVSLYSDAYANLPSATWVGASSLTDELLTGNPTKKMSNFIVEFINFAATDVSQMTTLHMDIYTGDCTGFNIWLLNNGDRNAQFFPTLNGWYSVDIPLSTYVNNGLNMTGLIQLKFEGLNGPGKTVYVDNVYFYRPATLPPATVGTFTVPAKNVGDANFALTPPSSNNTSPFTYMSSNNSIATIVGGNQIQIGTGGTCTITASQVTDGTYGPTSRTATFVVSFPAPGPSPIPPARNPAKVMSMYTGTPEVYATTPNYSLGRAFWTAGATLTEIPNGTNTALRADNLGYIGLIDTVSERRLDVTGMTNLHLDVYVNAPFANLFFWLLTDGDQRRDLTNLVAGWNSIDIPLSEFGGANLTNVYGLKFEQNTPNSLQIYLDNVYFSDDNVTYYADNDGDGYGNLLAPLTVNTGQPIGYVINSTDCDDSVAAINPGHVEVLYNGVDDNCDGNLDEGFQITTSMQRCGTTLASIGSLLSAVSLGAPVTGYRFEVTTVGSFPLEVQVFSSNTPNFSLTQLASYAYATTYSVRVMLQRSGVWLGYYGPACNISSPAVLAPGGSTSVTPSQCGITLPSISTLIATTSLAGATGYKFRVTNLRTNFQQELPRTIHWFSLSMLTQYNYGDTYTVEVAVKTTGAFSGYGSPCNVTAPAVPSLTSQCGLTIPTKNTNIVTASLALVTSYDFEVRNMTSSVTSNVSNNLNWFRLSMLPNYAASTQFRVRVRVLSSGVYSDYGDACFITSPAIARTVETLVDNNVFEVTASPNPFDNNFGMFLNATSTENVSIIVYDMIGRLIEQKTIKSNEVILQEVGKSYPSGVYNVVVSQGADVKTLRVIKR